MLSYAIMPNHISTLLYLMLSQATLSGNLMLPQTSTFKHYATLRYLFLFIAVIIVVYEILHRVQTRLNMPYCAT